VAVLVHPAIVLVRVSAVRTTSIVVEVSTRFRSLVSVASYSPSLRIFVVVYGMVMARVKVLVDSVFDHNIFVEVVPVLVSLTSTLFTSTVFKVLLRSTCVTSLTTSE
jgi:hypothetical protein